MACKEKIIKDAVHGYISIPLDYFKAFIDTPHFQRLRRIEQTSMRSLYPSARHDRFIHSIGTYHLGRKAIENIRHNSTDIELNDSIVESFKIACLLHDCGHAPFSHTFEEYFENNGSLRDLLKLCAVDNEDFHDNLEDTKAAPHEYLSAILAVTVFKNAIECFNADPLLVARMIVGAVYLHPDPRNALIQLLNGRAIDVDKLDYTVRDIAISGIKTNQIDLDRLLASLRIANEENGYKLCFYKNALSAINNVFEVKNFLYQWVFSHHTVQYDQYLLKECVKEAAKGFTSEVKSDKALSILFNPDTYLQRTDHDEPKIKMLCDDDLVHLIKKYVRPELANEWLYRQYQMVPLWKSYFEFSYLFGKSIKDSQSRIEKYLKSILNDEAAYLVLQQTEKHLIIEHNALYIQMPNCDVVPYGTLQFGQAIPESEVFYYVFVKKGLENRRDEIIQYLKQHIH